MKKYSHITNYIYKLTKFIEEYNIKPISNDILQTYMNTSQHNYYIILQIACVKLVLPIFGLHILQESPNYATKWKGVLKFG